MNGKQETQNDREEIILNILVAIIHINKLNIPF